MRLLFLFLFICIKSHATDKPMQGCAPEIKITHAIEKLNIADCKLAEGLIKNSEVQNFHRNKIYEKLSNKLALQIEQNLEETTLLDQYYSLNNKELLPSGESKVKKNCRLDTIGEIETCHGKVNPDNPSYRVKLNLLKAKIKNKLVASCSRSDLSLQEMLRDKVIQIIGVPSHEDEQCSGKKKTCPIEGATGAFTLASQLDSKSAQRFIDIVQDPKSSPSQIEAFFAVYPQFKLIKSTKGNLKNNFLNYLKNYKKNQGHAKEFVNRFFFDNLSNQQQLSETLATQCSDLNNNLDSFLCGKELVDDQLASLNSTASIELFGLNPDLSNEDIFDDAPGDGENFYAAYGFQCLVKTEKLKGIRANRENSVDTLFNNFNRNIRPQTSTPSDIETANNEFCSLYKCEEKNITESASCRNGGPLTVDGLKSIYDCEHKECSVNILKYISYLEGIKKVRAIQANGLAFNQSLNSSSGSSTEYTSRPRYSAFLENYLGAQGTLLAEGKKITPITIAEKSKEIAERKIDLPTLASQASQASDEKEPSIYATKGVPSTLVEQKSNQDNYNKVTRVPSQFDQNRNEVFTSEKIVQDTFSRDIAVKKTTNNIAAGTNNDSEAEIKRIRSELEDLTSSIKGSAGEKLAAIADINSRYSNSPKDFNNSDSSRDLNKAERERNDQYQRDLASWESRLRNWQNDLSNREARNFNSISDSAEIKKTDTSEGLAKSGKEGAIHLAVTDKDKAKSGNKIGAGINSSSSLDAVEAVILSDDFANLKIESLEKLGINSKSSFIIKVLHRYKYYNVPVKIFNYKGKDMLVPLLNESNNALSKIVLESPLFSEYKQFQADRQKERPPLHRSASRESAISKKI